MSDLADLIRDAVPDASNRAIAARVGVSPETINRVMRGEGAPDVETVDKIARALEINVEKAREAAALPRGHRESYQPPAEANLLDDRQRRAIDELIRSIVRTQATAATPDPADNVRDLNRRNQVEIVELPAAAYDPREESETERARRLQDEAAERGE